jgi:hypothetical protein
MQKPFDSGIFFVTNCRLIQISLESVDGVDAVVDNDAIVAGDAVIADEAVREALVHLRVLLRPRVQREAAGECHRICFRICSELIFSSGCEFCDFDSVVTYTKSLILAKFKSFMF